MTIPGQSNMGNWGGGSPVGDAGGISNPGAKQGGAGDFTIAAFTPVYFQLVNGVPTIFSESVPNDGVPHCYQFTGGLVVTTTEVGGALQLQYVLGGNPINVAVNGGGTVAGSQSFSIAFCADPGSTINYKQTSALTAGAAKVYAVLEKIL